MHHPQIKHESIIYDELAGGRKCINNKPNVTECTESNFFSLIAGMPQCHWHGQHEGFDCIVIDLLGPNLNQLRETTKTFSLEVVADFGCQMVTILEHIHKRGLVYRDVKPDNFLFNASCHLPEPEMVEVADDHGMPHIKYIHPTCEELFRKWSPNGTTPKLYIVDFGLTTWWRNPQTDKPYPETKRNIKNKTGTARYASLNVHRGKSHARRDDIESMGYLLLDLIFGTLPWTGIQARNSRAGWNRMRQIKEDTFMSDLCAGLPQGFLEFIEYARKLKFSEEPNYELLRQFLSGSIHGGKFSKIVRSPFGGHTERKWIQDIDKGQPEDNKDKAAAGANMPRSNLPRPRTTSYNHNDHIHTTTANEGGIFDMDDLANNLPSAQQQGHHQSQQHTPSKPRNINNGNRRTSRDFNNSKDGGPSSFQKLVMKNKKKQKRVGWNSHKHDEAPWIPATDWETTPAADNSKPNNLETPWGENNHNATWGIQEEGSWAANVDKP